MTKYIYLIVVLILFNSCKKEQKVECNCYDSNWPNFPIAAERDSIIICDTSKVIVRTGRHGDTTIVASYKNKTEYLSNTILGSGSQKIYDCITRNIIRHEFGPYHQYYKEKSLIIEPSKMLFYWDTTKIPPYLGLDSLALTFVDPKTNSGRWEQDSYPIYREKIYSENGIIRITEKEMILEPPYADSSSIKAVSTLFNHYHKNATKDEEIKGWLSWLEGKLLTCALNGDSISKERLINFKKYFPMYEEESLSESIDLLKEYEEKVHTHNKELS